MRATHAVMNDRTGIIQHTGTFESCTTYKRNAYALFGVQNLRVMEIVRAKHRENNMREFTANLNRDFGIS